MLKRENRNYLENNIIEAGLYENRHKNASVDTIPKVQQFVLETTDRVKTMEQKAMKLT